MLVERYGDDVPIDRFLLLIAKEEYPSVDVGRYLGMLDALADRALELSKDTGDLAKALTQTLFFEAGFKGNAKNYYDPKNSFLNEVIDRRLGIPITLSIVYMEVARRAGARAVGVGFPGHFLVRHDTGSRSLLLDPFEKGALVGRTECERLLGSLTGGPTTLEPWMLEPSTPRAIVVRVLANLKQAYMLKRDFINAVKTIDRLLIVEPDRWLDRRDRGLLFIELDCPKAAISDLEAYLQHGGSDQGADVLRRLIPELKKQIRLTN